MLIFMKISFMTKKYIFMMAACLHLGTCFPKEGSFHSIWGIRQTHGYSPFFPAVCHTDDLFHQEGQGQPWVSASDAISEWPWWGKGQKASRRQCKESGGTD